MTDVDTQPKAGEVETVKDRMARFAAVFDEHAPELSPEEIAFQIAAQILAQDTVETILASRDTVSSRDYVGQRFVLLGLDVRESTIDGEGPGRYMVLRCVDTDGQPFAMTSGSMNIMAAAWNLVDRGLVPVDCVVKKADRPSANGFYPLWLELPPK